MPWPETPCPICPRSLAGLSLPCRAQTSRHRRFCELADPGHPDHDPAYAAMLRDEEPVDEARVAPMPPRPTVAASLDLIRRRNACPHAECRTGCQATLCRFPWRRRAVSLDDCRVCLGPA